MADSSVASPTAPQTFSWRTQLFRGAMVMLAAGLTAALYFWGNRIPTAALMRYGYVGIFIISVLAYATVIVPLPAPALAFVAGGVLLPWLVAIVAGLGASVGQMTGYLAGLGGRVVVENRGIYARLQYWMRRYGPVVIFVVAFIPSPFFDFVGILAGAFRMPVRVFFFWCALGQILKMLVFAYAGNIWRWH